MKWIISLSMLALLITGVTIYSNAHQQITEKGVVPTSQPEQKVAERGVGPT